MQVQWWTQSNPTLCKRICLNFLHSQAVAMQKLRPQVLTPLHESHLVEFPLPNVLFITAKLGQGNVFRSVCQEFCPQGGGLYPSMPCRSPGPHPGGGGLRSLVGGVPGPHPGVFRPTPRGCVSQHALKQTLPPSRWLPLQAVCILLECILVIIYFNMNYISNRVNCYFLHICEAKIAIIPLPLPSQCEHYYIATTV